MVKYLCVVTYFIGYKKASSDSQPISTDRATPSNTPTTIPSNTPTTTPSNTPTVLAAQSYFHVQVKRALVSPRVMTRNGTGSDILYMNTYIYIYTYIEVNILHVTYALVHKCVTMCPFRSVSVDRI
jgi:hypothetical protein